MTRLRAGLAFPGLLWLGACLGGMPAPPQPVAPPEPDEIQIPNLDEQPNPGVGDPPPWEEWARETDAILESPWALHPEVEARVAYWTAFWQTRGRGSFTRYLERMGRYNHLVDLHIQERGLPPSLRYLPIVESGYNTGAVSQVGATGLWQFMGPTARGMGLTVDGILDERRDPLASTAAALDYLAELHERFGSWFLALSAYNAGPGRVGGILSRSVPAVASGLLDGDSLFVAHRDRFPLETRDFVPRLLAAARIARDPEGHGFIGVEPLPPLHFDDVEVPDAVSLDVVARAALADAVVIQGLNPHLVRGFTPVGVPTRIRVPEGEGAAFLTRLLEIPRNEWVTFVEHRVARGETLSHIASRYGVPLADLQGANGGLDPRRLQIGQRLVVPVGGRGRGGSRVQVASALGPAAGAGSRVGSGASAPAGGGAQRGGTTTPIQHRVRSGESLWAIARGYGVTVEQLRAWNGLRSGSVLAVGRVLEVHAPSGGVTEYRVQSGDTLGGIALRHGVSASELARFNGLTTTAIIRTGDRLRIPAQGG
ncbi:MAG: LysM peptidoglycan-binding domain-containing protein [Gemmatimonadota bacterium]